MIYICPILLHHYRRYSILLTAIFYLLVILLCINKHLMLCEELCFSWAYDKKLTSFIVCFVMLYIHVLKTHFYLVRETPCMIYWRIFLLQGYAQIIVDLRWEMEAHLRQQQKTHKKHWIFFKCTANTSLEKHIDTYVIHNLVIATKWWLGHNDNILCLWLND